MDPRLVIWTGDFPRALGLRIHLNVVTILASLMSMSSSLIWYYNYIKGIEPKHLQLFQVMSGQIPPKILGSNNKKEIQTLIKWTNISIKVANFQSCYVAICGSVSTPMPSILLERLKINRNVVIITINHVIIESFEKNE